MIENANEPPIIRLLRQELVRLRNDENYEEIAMICNLSIANAIIFLMLIAGFEETCQCVEHILNFVSEQMAEYFGEEDDSEKISEH